MCRCHLLTTEIDPTCDYHIKKGSLVNQAFNQIKFSMRISKQHKILDITGSVGFLLGLPAILSLAANLKF